MIHSMSEPVAGLQRREWDDRLRAIAFGASAVMLDCAGESARGLYIGRPLAIHSSVLPIESRYRAQLYGSNCSSSTRERS